MISRRTDLRWCLRDVAEHLGGDLVGDPRIRVASVTIDSRNVDVGALFVAIAGEHFDGHNFASDSVGAGAVAVVVRRGRHVEVEPRIEVDDTLEALRSLAVRRRDELGIPVVAVTGSTGKTSTKDLIAAGIPGAWASPRSYNNEVGVPLTVLATPIDATALIVEVGSRGAGHIAWLAPAIRPDVAVVTNLGVVHLETFGSPEGLANAKFELIESLRPAGTAVLPSNEERLARPIPQRTITFGSPPCDVEVSQVGVDADGGSRFTLDVGSRSFDVSLAMAGTHQAYNAAAAVSVARALDLPVESFIEGMCSAVGSLWRMDVHREGRYTVVNDAYNANPQSVAAALETVAHMPGRSIAVLGPMAELGSVCEEEHRAMGRLAASLGFHKVIVVGADHGYGLGAPDVVVYATDTAAAMDTLSGVLESGDVVVVKASRSAGLERLALALIKESTP
ncbi:MAG: UDP-N-acetylmuramoyl-tripeptide--D-alanyl-D-alanine ligase [Actinomycetia bacterium]|nr:UDP-N-acetylmuramoyl-tripeptide--D-alanyl-D-alanine ligase [Actinomycetes bacterium]